MTDRSDNNLSPFDILLAPFRLLIDHSNLFWMLLKRDLETTVRGSILGVAWLVVTPLILVAIYTFVFGLVMKSTWFDKTESGLEVPLIYFCSIIIFSFFMEVLTRSSELLRNNSPYVKKIIFPVALLDWVVVGSAMVKFATGLGLLALFLLMVKGTIPTGFFAIPLIMLPLVLFMTGLAWFITAIGTYIRDVNHLLVAIGPVLMFVSPIFYELSQVPEAFRWVFWINPLTFPLESTRGLVFFQTQPNWGSYAWYSAASYGIFILGFGFFQKARRGFADVI